MHGKRIQFNADETETETVPVDAKDMGNSSLIESSVDITERSQNIGKDEHASQQTSKPKQRQKG